LAATISNRRLACYLVIFACLRPLPLHLCGSQAVQLMTYCRKSFFHVSHHERWAKREALRL
jgi:hypothetical protein